MCLISALAGAFLMVRAFATSVEPFSLGTVRVRAIPSTEGRVDVYVPIVDWGVRASPYRAPVAVELRFRSLDRAEALETLESGTTADENLEALRSELAELGRSAMRRSLLLGLAGGVGGGLVGGALVGAFLRRRRWLAYGAGIGLLVPLTFLGIVLVTLRDVDYQAFEEPTFYANGAELPRLLSLSEQVLSASEGYTESYEQSLAGLANLVAFASEDRDRGPSGATAVLASDLHANMLVLPVLGEYTQGNTVFLAGDFSLRGTRTESRLIPLIRGLGETVVAVSGNHDSRPFMLALAQAGVIVLTRNGRLLPDGSTDGRPVAQIDGWDVAGFDDPLEAPTARFEPRSLDLTGTEFTAAADELRIWFEQLPSRPDIVLVHQHGLAHALLDGLGEDDGEGEVLILTGHDHEQHLHEEDGVVLVDGGTVGAGGPFEIGVQSAGFAEIHFTDGGSARAVDLIEVEPVSGNASATRVVLDDAP
ncbi:MAG: metallophosphoesterase family protein [Gaiellaceae bacterium]